MTQLPCSDSDRVLVSTAVVVLTSRGVSASCRAERLEVVLPILGERTFPVVNGALSRKIIGELAHRSGIPVELFYHPEMAQLSPADLRN